MIRPQTKKAKEAKLFREGIKKGDKIVTIGGVHGKIAEINEATVIIETEGGGKLKIDKTAISQEASAALNKAS
jgi:preprotein translocase subunit YajC